MALETRAARNDLTSRECARILGALLGPLVGLAAHQAGPGPVDSTPIREVLNLVRLYVQGERAPLAAADPQLAYATATLAGLCEGIEAMALRGAVLNAIDWWLERDDAWRMLEEVIEATRAKKADGN
jgi:hypothetical protein